MVEVLVYIVEHYSITAPYQRRLQLARHLEELGFDAKQINEAFDWLLRLFYMVNQGSYQLNSSISHRVYAAEEQNLLTMEVRGLILTLENRHAISATQREIIIDRLLSITDTEVTLVVAKLVILLVLYITKTRLPNIWNEKLPKGMHTMH